MIRFSVFFLLTFLYSSCCNAQLSHFVNREKFNWNLWDQVRNKYDKMILLDSINRTFQLGLYESNEDNHGDFRFIDFNADQLVDLIFLDRETSSDVKTHFFLNQGSTYTKLLELDGELIYLNREKPWSPVSFELTRTSKEDTEDIEIEVCSHAFSNGELEYKVTRQYLIRKNMKLIRENVPPRLFTVPEGGIFIRTHPDPQHGKKIADYPEGKTGYAIGSRLNRSGNIWWLVMLKEEGEKFRVGWVNSSEIKDL